MPRSEAGTAGLRSPAAQVGILVGAFVLGTLLAKAFGAEWGTASAFGQMAFAAALVTVLLRAP